MKVTDEIVMAAIHHKYGVELVPDDRMKDKMRALLHSACHVMTKQEPVAYIGEDPDHGTRISKRKAIAECWGIPYEPLYKHPQPKREPLSEDELGKIFNRCFDKDYTVFARSIEKAHGIGVEE
jgi:hypothetical protein